NYMAQEIEIEFKNLLTEEEYLKLLSNLPFPKYSQTQTNYYFETEDFSLKAHGSALRIREKNGNYTLTLKETHELGLLETHDALTE
ncbi:CYTH domain-containing protein, partial [Salmonella enterica]|uniref:CYTH domain-containing protein n=1 Tax=Salmonella enterica TaxID=28901 RepID=UPI001BAF34DD